MYPERFTMTIKYNASCDSINNKIFIIQHKITEDDIIDDLIEDKHLEAALTDAVKNNDCIAVKAMVNAFGIYNDLGQMAFLNAVSDIYFASGTKAVFKFVYTTKELYDNNAIGGEKLHDFFSNIRKTVRSEAVTLVDEDFTKDNYHSTMGIINTIVADMNSVTPFNNPAPVVG